MRILHISDTHGNFPKLGKSAAVKRHFDAVVHTGDFFPNCNGGPLEQAAYQYGWIQQKIVRFKNWIQQKPYLFVLGNHDFMDPELLEEFLKKNGVDAYNLTEKVVGLNNVNFYGFPFVPPINGHFNYEKNSYDMADKVDAMVEVLNKTYVDVIAAHCPPEGILDFSTWQRQRFGNSQMTTALDYKISKDMMPQAYLCGHIHENHGMATKHGVLFSNAATVQHFIEV